MNKLTKHSYSDLIVKSMRVTSLAGLLEMLRSEVVPLLPCESVDIAVGRRIGPGYLFVWKGVFDIRFDHFSSSHFERFSEDQVYFMHWLATLNPIVMLSRTGRAVPASEEVFVVRQGVQRDEDSVFSFMTARGVTTKAADRRELAARMRVIAPVVHAVVARLLKTEPSTDFNGHMARLEVQLLPTQLTVLAWMCAGLSNAEIAKVMQRPLPTIDRHVQGIIEALDVNSRREAVVEACLQGMMASWIHLQQLAGSILATMDRIGGQESGNARAA